ncbi:hypothetical protein G5I_11146 [Acromyrmex echinatior]|uniref:Uncharacterized protein n=1 Tax=Acromyrmex echinatior TaxID=103372 RepID=F4WYT2_ACREC|nr:hypothetical protein G5I_11146 [Acromyrmex echinatior]
MTIWGSKLHVGRESAVARVNRARSARSGFYSVIVWNHKVNGFSGKCMKNKSSATGAASCQKSKTPFCHKGCGIFSLLCSGKCNRRASLRRVSWDRRRIRSELRYPDKRRSVFTTQSRINRKSQRCQPESQRLNAKIHARRSAVVTTNNDEDTSRSRRRRTIRSARPMAMGCRMQVTPGNCTTRPLPRVRAVLVGNRSVCPPATRSSLSPFALSTIVKNQDRSDHPPQALRVIIVVWYGIRGSVG